MVEAETSAQGADGVGRAILLVLLANLLFAFVDTSTKWLIGAGLAVLPLAFMRYAVHFGLTIADRTIRARPAYRLRRGVTWLVLFRSICIVSATLANFVALGHLSLSVTASILYLSPVFICLFARPMLGEIVTAKHWSAILLGLIGALVILWPVGEPINWYAVLMLYPAIALALYQVLTRQLAHEVRPSTLQFYTGAVGTVVLLPFALVSWTTPVSPLDWTLFLAIGAFAWAGHEALIRAHSYTEASTLAPFGYIFINYLTGAEILVFGELPELRVFAGAALIFAGGMLAWRVDRRLAS
ncbi:MAG: DMT family transporter [Pseudomonadota bacterium]